MGDLIPGRKGSSSFTRRVLIGVNVLFIALFTLSALIVGGLVESNLRAASEERTSSFAEFISVVSSSYLRDKDLIALERLAQETLREKTVAYVVFYDSQGKVLTQTGNNRSEDQAVRQLEMGISDMNGESLGRVLIGVTNAYLTAQVRQVYYWLFGVVVSLLMVLSTLVLLVVKRFSGRLSLAFHEIAVSSDVLLQTADDLAQGSQYVGEKISEQSSAVAQTVAAMAEMSGMIQASAEKFKEVERLAKNVGSQTGNGKSIMNSMETWMESIQEANSRLQNIEVIIEEISEKAQIINDIVFKTQILSFNASIEAARAGTHGRGFAVVAEEVGNLAETSGAAATEISNLLSTSRSQVKSILDTVTQRVIEGRTVASDAVDIFNEISSEVTNIVGQVEGVREANHEQDISIGQVREAMSRIDAATETILQMSSKSQHSSSILEGQIQVLHRYLDMLQGMISVSEESLGHSEDLSLVTEKIANGKGDKHSPSQKRLHERDFDDWIKNKTGS
jgi:methyl-accepting chemotaxis protein